MYFFYTTVGRFICFTVLCKLFKQWSNSVYINKKQVTLDVHVCFKSHIMRAILNHETRYPSFNSVVLWLVSDCPVNSLPSKCIIHDNCFGFQCCIDIDLKITQRNISIYFHLDPCNFELSVGLGQWYLNKSLFTYAWGTEETFTLGNAIIVRYKYFLCFNESVYFCNSSCVLRFDR